MANEPTFYRNRFGVPLTPKPQPQPGTASEPAHPEPDGKVWGEANTGTVGALREVFGGRGLPEIEIPCAVAPAGTVNRPVQLVRNDFPAPMYVRIRLSRNGAEGRIAIASTNSIRGQVGSQPQAWLDLTTEPGRKYDALLMNGEVLFAIGTWAGVVPLSVFVTVAAWNP